MLFKKIIFIILVTLITIPLFASNSTSIVTSSLTGVVVDKSSGAPLIGVNVYFPDLRKGAITDGNGKYEINNLPAITQSIEISYTGYQTITKDINLRTNRTANFAMTESNSELNEVIVTGVSKATQIKQSPVPIVAVDKVYLNENSASNNIIAEITHIPGISTVTTGPNISKPFIHGLGYNRVVTLLDGIRIEGQQWGDEHGIEVDQNAINHIEVIKGPASLTYGSGAIAGVINLITAPTIPDGRILGSFSNDYGTNNGLINTSFQLQGNNNGLVWGTVLTNKLAKNYENQHDGRVYATGFKEKDARVMIGLNKSWGYSYLNASVFDDIQDIPDGSRDSLTRQFTYQITDADTYRPIVPASMLDSYATPALHQHVQMYNIYDNSSFNIGNNTLLLNLGYQYSHRREYTHPQNPSVPGLNLELHTLNYDLKYNFTPGNNYETTIGLNGMYQDNKLGKNSTDFPIPAYRLFDIGAFVFAKKSFGKVDVSAGGRYDTRVISSSAAYIDTTVTYFPSLYYGQNPTGTPNVIQQFNAFHKTFSGPSGSLGAAYNVSNALLLKANIATGFRAPSIAELSANGADPGSQIYHVGNINFKPEYSIQGDIGAYITLPVVSASAELYDNNIENYIFQEQMTDANGTPERVNANGSLNPNGQYSRFTYTQTKARILGGDFTLDIHPLAWLHFENSLTLTYGTNLGNHGNEPDSLRYLPFIPPLHTYSALRATFSKGFNWFRGMYGYIGLTHFEPQKRFFAAYGTETYTAGYNLLSAGFGGNIVNRKGEKVVELYIEGTNLANVNYQSNMSRLKYFDNPVVPAGIQPGIFNMGRNVSLKVVIPFDLSPKTKVTNKI
ncbi:TonB-dependent receptor [Microbacter margulisiae]|uniref:Iron complex outermembrane receptor protein n=1 Tax=Microbacter margulisiae TaxID=1350067 RepID=A0A7W5DQC3_9PORP|nr:TonB-dependent receptor [Microbacter margulisiae]MBB3187109.1 iron complex outermembrane receptor protein [Microbacter margulisiae]